MKRKLVVVVVLAAAVTAAVVVWQLRLRAAGNGAGLRVYGNIEVTDVELSFRLPGWVKERPVDEGDLVKAGQLVARLDPTDLGIAVELQKAQAAAAEAALAELENGSRPQEIAAAEATLARARSDAALARTELVRARQLHDQKLIADQDFDASRATSDSAAAAADQADANLKLVREGPRREEIDAARARLAAARQSLELARAQLGYATLTSPVSGVVLTKNTEAGEYVSPGTAVVTVADVTRVWLRAYIDEPDLGRVKVGARAQVTADTWPGKVYAGRVSFISSEAEFTPKNIQTQKERVKLVYRVKIDINNRQMELKPGMPAQADIAVERP